MATTHEISQTVINAPQNRAVEVGLLGVEASMEQPGAEAVYVDEAPVGAEAMKKSFIRKKEIPSADDVSKKQKSKVANVRK